MENSAGMSAHPSSRDYENLAMFLMLAVICRNCPHFFLFFLCNYSSVFHVSGTKCGAVIDFSLPLHGEISGAGTRISSDNLNLDKNLQSVQTIQKSLLVVNLVLRGLPGF